MSVTTPTEHASGLRTNVRQFTETPVGTQPPSILLSSPQPSTTRPHHGTCTPPSDLPETEDAPSINDVRSCRLRRRAARSFGPRRGGLLAVAVAAAAVVCGLLPSSRSCGPAATGWRYRSGLRPSRWRRGTHRDGDVRGQVGAGPRRAVRVHPLRPGADWGRRRPLPLGGPERVPEGGTASPARVGWWRDRPLASGGTGTASPPPWPRIWRRTV